MSRGAAIAFYATTALVPVLFIIVSIAGSLFGEPTTCLLSCEHALRIGLIGGN